MGRFKTPASELGSVLRKSATDAERFKTWFAGEVEGEGKEEEEI